MWIIGCGWNHNIEVCLFVYLYITIYINSLASKIIIRQAFGLYCSCATKHSSSVRLKSECQDIVCAACRFACAMRANGVDSEVICDDWDEVCAIYQRFSAVLVLVYTAHMSIS